MGLDQKAGVEELKRTKETGRGELKLISLIGHGGPPLPPGNVWGEYRRVIADPMMAPGQPTIQAPARVRLEKKL